MYLMCIVYIPKHNLIILNGIIPLARSINLYIDELNKLKIPIKHGIKQKYFNIYINLLKRELSNYLNNRDIVCSTNNITSYKNVFLFCINCIKDVLPSDISSKKFIAEIKKIIYTLNLTEWDSIFHVTETDCFTNVSPGINIYSEQIPGDIADQIGIITSIYL